MMRGGKGGFSLSFQAITRQGGIEGMKAGLIF
jgi:hypothetical protein